MKCYNNDRELQQEMDDSERINCYKMLHKSGIPKPGWCPGTWDSLICWNHTQSQNYAVTNCPTIPGFNSDYTASKYCTENGTWWINSVGYQWSNYTQCIHTEWIQFQSTIQKLYMSGYCISIISLAFGLCLYRVLRTLTSSRITIHKHLFLSFILTNILSLVQLHVTAQPNILLNNPLWCRILTVLSKYLIVCNYAWMFCEGLYLHTMLMYAFVATEKRLLQGLYIIGWGVPLLPLSAYVTLRSTCIIVRHQHQRCWTIHAPQFRWVIMAFIAFFQFVNVIFVVNILRVVASKLRAQQQIQSSDQETRVLKGSIKALMVLIPLLGLYSIAMTAYRPEDKLVPKVIAYQCVYAIMTSLQGFFVAIVICFLNGEVHSALSIRLRQWLVVRHPRSESYFRNSSFQNEFATSTTLIPQALRGHHRSEGDITSPGGSMGSPTAKRLLINKSVTTTKGRVSKANSLGVNGYYDAPLF